MNPVFDLPLCDLEIIRYLEPLLSLSRQKTLRRLVDHRLKFLELAVESPADIYNALAMVRTADAFGVFNMHVIADELKRGRGKRASMGSYKWVDLKKHASLTEFKKYTKQSNVKVIGTSSHAKKTLFDIKIEKPTVLMFGNEHRGLSQEALDYCDDVFQIPMFGMVESFNLSVSSALCLHHLTSNYRNTTSLKGDLSEDEKRTLYAKYLISHIGKYKALGILKELLKRENPKEKTPT